MIFTVAIRSGLSVEDAEDCLQGTWLALYRTRQTIRDPGKLPGWLTKTARRQAYRIRQRGEQESTRREKADRPTETLLPDEELLKIERDAILQLALNQLDDRCRAIVHALFYAPEDKGYGDIAPQTALGKFLAAAIMILGYGIIAVPTGIITFEIAGAARQRISTRACPQCAAEGHDTDAIFCKSCGAPL